ncbi:hypothetical protein HDU92_001564 [Lobulomyces angularis]|nr:hypothetical protein HDU92_001564 [Lobulomyces angularis]
MDPSNLFHQHFANNLPRNSYSKTSPNPTVSNNNNFIPSFETKNLLSPVSPTNTTYVQQENIKNNNSSPSVSNYNEIENYFMNTTSLDQIQVDLFSHSLNLSSPDVHLHLNSPTTQSPIDVDKFEANRLSILQVTEEYRNIAAQFSSSDQIIPTPSTPPVSISNSNLKTNNLNYFPEQLSSPFPFPRENSPFLRPESSYSLTAIDYTTTEFNSITPIPISNENTDFKSCEQVQQSGSYFSMDSGNSMRSNSQTDYEMDYQNQHPSQQNSFHSIQFSSSSNNNNSNNNNDTNNNTKANKNEMDSNFFHQPVPKKKIMTPDFTNEFSIPFSISPKQISQITNSELKRPKSTPAVNSLTTDSVKYRCKNYPYCTKDLKTLNGMKYHNDVSKKCEFEIGKNEEINLINNKISTELKNLLKSKNIKIIEKKYSCKKPNCNNIYKSYNGLKYHRLNEHNEIDSSNSDTANTTNKATNSNNLNKTSVTNNNHPNNFNILNHSPISPPLTPIISAYPRSFRSASSMY